MSHVHFTSTITNLSEKKRIFVVPQCSKTGVMAESAQDVFYHKIRPKMLLLGLEAVAYRLSSLVGLSWSKEQACLRL